MTVECSELLPEGGRDRSAKLLYHPEFAEGEARASLGNLFKDDQQQAVVGHEELGQFNSCYVTSDSQCCSTVCVCVCVRACVCVELSFS